MAEAVTLGGKGHPPPPEYSDLLLCRLYHCRPSELDEEDAERIMLHIACLNEERKK